MLPLLTAFQRRVLLYRISSPCLLYTSPCVNHLQQRFFVVTSGTDRTDNFGFSHMFSLFYLITIYQTIPVWIIHVKYILRKQIKEFLTENFLLLFLEQLTPNR